jgi:histidyl-tRNA synthetase
MPALGFGMGDVVLLELLKSRGLLPAFDSHIEAFCLIEDEELRAPSLELIQHLRESGYAVDYFLTPAKSDKQFKRAMELKARFTIKLEKTGQQAVVVRMKNLQTREEKVVTPPDLPEALGE